MIKQLFILINGFIITLLSWIGGDDVKISSKFPSKIIIGKEVTLQFTIKKGDISGFGKFQLEIPEGITIKDAGDNGAVYSYKDGIAKWIWATLLLDEEIGVRIVVVASENALGLTTFKGRFSYIDNNEKKDIEMKPAEVNVVAFDDAIAKKSADSLKESKVIKDPLAESNKEPAGEINIYRSIVKEKNNEIIVNLRIEKGNTKGFARYSDDLPDGFSVKVLRTDGSSFSVSDKKIKFVWVNVPLKDELQISYAITAVQGSSLLLDGEYSYLEANQSQKLKLDAESIVFDFVKGDNTEELTQEKVKEKKLNGKVAPVEEKSKDRNNLVMPERKEGSINYVVQIGAFTNPKVNSEILKKKFNISEQIDSEMQGGFYKFMVGSHSLYKNARDHRELVISNNAVKSAFVAAYNGNKRITVQEALMVTNQKWFR